MHGEFRAIPQGSRAVFALLVDGVKADVAERGQLFFIVAVARRDAFDSVHRRFGGRHPAAHILDHRMRPVNVNALFAAPGRARRADFVVDVQPAADQRRIADSPRYLPCHPGGRRHTGHVTVGVNGQTVNRAGRAVAKNLFDAFIEGYLFRRELHLRGFDIAGGRGLMPTRPPEVLWVQALAPLQPLFARLFGQQILVLEPMFERETYRAIGHQQYVIRPRHDYLGDARRILNAMEVGHRPGPTRRPMHHARVKLDLAIFIRQSAVAYGVVVWIVLNDVDARDHRLKRVSALFQHPHREFDATDAAPPRGSTPRFGTLAPFALAITTGRAWPNAGNRFCLGASAKLSPANNGALKPAVAAPLMKSLRLRFSWLIRVSWVWGMGSGEWGVGKGSPHLPLPP